MKKWLMVIAAAIVINIGEAEGNPWIDQWVDQAVHTKANYFEGQQRNHFGLGGVQLRQYTSKDRLITATPPSYKIGCGGIDINYGAYSMISGDQMVDKFEAALVGAAFIAFDMALNELCPQCAATVAKAEKISQQINQMQMDDCEAGKAIATYAYSEYQSGEGKASEDAEASVETGREESWYDSGEKYEGNQGKPQVDGQEKIQECPQDIKDIFFAAGSDSVLLNMYKVSGADDALNKAMIELARGMVGDIAMKLDNSAGVGQYLPKIYPPCANHKMYSVDNIIDGEVHARSLTNGECSLVSSEKGNLREYVTKQMEGIADAMKSRSTIEPYRQFIEVTATPVYDGIGAAVRTQQESTFIPVMSDVVARQYAHGMMTDLYMMINGAIRQIKAVVASAGSSEGMCKVEYDMALLLPTLEQMKKDTMEYTLLINTDMAQKARETNEMAALHERIKRIDELNKRTFGRSLTRRLDK